MIFYFFEMHLYLQLGGNEQGDQNQVTVCSCSFRAGFRIWFASFAKFVSQCSDKVGGLSLEILDYMGLDVYKSVIKYRKMQSQAYSSESSTRKSFFWILRILLSMVFMSFFS